LFRKNSQSLYPRTARLETSSAASKGAKPLIESDNREIVIALREIADGKVRWATPKT
jgi:hypothetical protein